MFCINKQKIKYLIYENSHYNLVPDHGSEGDAERVEDRVTDAGQNDAEEDEREAEPIDPSVSGIVARLLQRVRVKRGCTHSGRKSSQVRSENWKRDETI